MTTVLPRAFRSWTMGGRLSPGRGQIGLSSTDDHRLAPGEVADGYGAGLDRGEGARAGVGRRPRGAALDAGRILPDDVELAARLCLQVADRAPPRAARAAGPRAGGEGAALQAQGGAQLPVSGLLAEEEAAAVEAGGSRPAAAAQRDGELERPALGVELAADRDRRGRVQLDELAGAGQAHENGARDDRRVAGLARDGRW